MQDIITVEKAMEMTKLGPNGAFLYCMDFLEKNVQWLYDKIEAVSKGEDIYFIFDCPGQSEIFTTHKGLKNIVDGLVKKFDFRVLLYFNLFSAYSCLSFNYLFVYLVVCSLFYRFVYSVIR